MSKTAYVLGGGGGKIGFAAGIVYALRFHHTFMSVDFIHGYKMEGGA